MQIDHEALYFIASYGTLCVLCCGVALIDLRHGIIPDWLNLAIAALGLANVVVTESASSTSCKTGTNGDDNAGTPVTCSTCG